MSSFPGTMLEHHKGISKLYMMMGGSVALNRSLYIDDKPCPKNHNNVGEKSIRYKRNKACAICVAFNAQQRLHKKLSDSDKVHNKAIKTFEDIEFQRELKRIEEEEDY